MRNTSGLRRTAGPGRPKGLPNRATREFKAWAEQFFKSPDYRRSAERRILSGKAPQLETYLAQLLYGKPKESIEIDDKRPESYRFVFGTVPVSQPTEDHGPDE